MPSTSTGMSEVCISDSQNSNKIKRTKAAKTMRLSLYSGSNA